MKKLVIEHSIKIIWFYGEPGHGCGLVEAMSSFGCKSQLRSEIITNDSWFESTEQMVKCLKDYFQSDDSKEHFLVDAAESARPFQERRAIACARPHTRAKVFRRVINCTCK